MDFKNLAPIFKDEIVKELGCSERTALRIIKESGCGYKIGRRWAMPFIAFIYFLQGRKYTGIEIADGGSIHAVQ